MLMMCAENSFMQDSQVAYIDLNRQKSFQYSCEWPLSECS